MANKSDRFPYMNLKKLFYLILGMISLVLGTIGVFLPVLPTVPLYLLTLFCFARSSERLHDWFISTELYKNNLESYVKKEGMTAAVKLRIFSTVTVMMLISGFFMRRLTYVLVILSVVWLFHLLYLLFGVKTIHPSA